MRQTSYLTPTKTPASSMEKRHTLKPSIAPLRRLDIGRRRARIAPDFLSSHPEQHHRCAYYPMPFKGKGRALFLPMLPDKVKSTTTITANKTKRTTTTSISSDPRSVCAPIFQTPPTSPTAMDLPRLPPLKRRDNQWRSRSENLSDSGIIKSPVNLMPCFNDAMLR